MLAALGRMHSLRSEYADVEWDQVKGLEPIGRQCIVLKFRCHAFYISL